MIVSATPNKEHKPRRAQKKKGCATPQQKQWNFASHTTGTPVPVCQCKLQFCNKGRKDSEFLRSSWSLLGALSRGLRDSSMGTSSSILLFFRIQLRSRTVASWPVWSFEGVVVTESCLPAPLIKHVSMSQTNHPPRQCFRARFRRVPVANHIWIWAFNQLARTTV